MVQRLPFVNGDDGAWGTILNNFLGKEHWDNGTDNTAAGGHQTITIRPGVSTANGAPLKFLLTSAAKLTTPEAGAVEFVGNRMYYTQTTGPTRLNILAVDDTISGLNGDMYYRNATGDMAVLPVGSNTQVLTVSSGVPTWAAAPGAGGGLSQQQVMGITSMRI